MGVKFDSMSPLGDGEGTFDAQVPWRYNVKDGARFLVGPSKLRRWQYAVSHGEVLVVVFGDAVTCSTIV